MIKYYCDSCGCEIKESANNSEFVLDKVRVKVLVSISDVANGGHICVGCVKHTVQAGAVYNQYGVVATYPVSEQVKLTCTDDDPPF